MKLFLLPAATLLIATSAFAQEYATLTQEQEQVVTEIVPEASLEDANVRQFLRGVTLGNNNCNCNWDGDCNRQDCCKITRCNEKHGNTGGHCVSRGGNHRSDRSCDYKQCKKRGSDSSGCSCYSDQYCVKGDGVTCDKRGGNDNGCCVYDEVVEGFFLG
eukprot:550577_1